MVIFCGIDPGFQGGISIISEDTSETPIVYRMPVLKMHKVVKGKKKTKQFYDLVGIREIFQKHLDKDSVIVVERVSPHAGEGSVSSFSFGRGYGNLEGIIVGLFNKTPGEVAPVSWKKHFPELVNDEIRGKKEEAKEIRARDKILPAKPKTIEEKEAKKENKKQIDKLNRQVKAIAKTLARELASSLHPELADNFKLKNSDGVAESLLIAIYGRDK